MLPSDAAAVIDVRSDREIPLAHVPVPEPIRHELSRLQDQFIRHWLCFDTDPDVAHELAELRALDGHGREIGQRREQVEIPAGSILVAEDLTPSDTVALDPTKVVGFCTTAGGASSHVAILARALDIPAVAGIDPRVLDVADGTRVRPSTVVV